MLRFDAAFFGERMPARQSDHKRIFKQNDGLHRAALAGKREQHHIEFAPVQRGNEAVGQVLHQIELKAAIGFAQARQASAATETDRWSEWSPSAACRKGVRAKRW